MAPNWLQAFLKQLKRLLGFSSLDRRPKIRILEEYHADGISVLRLEDTSIPGCVDLWRIDRHYERSKFFICILNTALLREDLALLRTSLDALASTRGRRMADLLQQQLQEQAHIAASHLWITGWNKEISGIDAQGRHYRSHRTVDVQLLACDLQGTATTFAGDRYAHQFARKVIKQLAACEFREYHHHLNWQTAVKAIDWVQWLEGLSKQHIDLYHTLQPHRIRRPSGI